MEKTHYTYVIRNIHDGRYYIGVRSCEGSPFDDTAYMGSSRKWTPDFKSDPAWEKFIIQTYTTRKEAEEDEYAMLVDGHFGNIWCLNRGVSRSGVNILSPHAIRERGKAISATLTKPDVKAKRSAAQKSAQNRPDVKAKRSASIKAAHARPEVKLNQQAAAQANNAKPDVKAKIGKANKLNWTDPVIRAKRCQSMKDGWKKRRDNVHCTN